MVKDGEVVIVDEFTGRQMPGRRWSDGLHQAVEAKEGVKIERENQTLATITFQNYFRMYKKLSGMTGTAETEAPEFDKIYELDVVAIPTNRTLIRIENSDVVYRTEAEKFEAAVNGIMQEDGTRAGGSPPVLRERPARAGRQHLHRKIGKHRGALLKKAGIPHQVLNAKQHEREANIIAQAGRKGAVTVSTNMAGRGTDILLGGNPEAMTRDYCLKNKLAMPYAPASSVIGAAPGTETPRRPMPPPRRQQPVTKPSDQWRQQRRDGAVPAWKAKFSRCPRAVEADLRPVRRSSAKPSTTKWSRIGGLHILGTERHEARRIDNQLRGRAGRQGDPGSSRFFLSLEDDLLRIFGGERVKKLDVPPRHDRRRAHRIAPDQQPHRERAESRRSAKLRSPQTPARIRRRDEQAARDDLRPAPLVPRRPRPKGIRPRARRRHRRRTGRNLLPARAASGSVERHAIFQRSSEPVWLRSQSRRHGFRDAEPRQRGRDADRKGAARATRKKKNSSARRRCAGSSATSCWMSWTASGKTTC